MKRFAALFAALDQTSRSSLKVAALAQYFSAAPDADKVWAIALFAGRRPRRCVTTTLLRIWAAEQANLPDWLFDESFAMVGDLAETIALILPRPIQNSDQSLTHWITLIRALATQPEADRKAAILAAWDRLPPTERLVFNKLITGGFRAEVSQKLMSRALAQATDLPAAELAHRLMGDWQPDAVTFHALVHAPDPQADLSRPYPFALASALQGDVAGLGLRQDWAAEWKWDGMRGQLILRGGAHFLWSRGEEVMTNQFPELAQMRNILPDGTVLDGAVLVWEGERPLPLTHLQKRLGRKTAPKRLLAEVPVVFLAYDLLEWHGEDWRARPFAQRRAALVQLVDQVPKATPLKLSPMLDASDWDGLAQARDNARDHCADGLMLKRLSAPYGVGRTQGDWWKWKAAPLMIDAVMIYAQAGHGSRATQYSDFTFAVRSGNDLVPFTKAGSGLTDAELQQITVWVKANTLERFGPVRRVPPEHVFEIAFDGINASPRHKSGVVLRSARINRWRHDKAVDQANNLDDLHALLAQFG